MTVTSMLTMPIEQKPAILTLHYVYNYGAILQSLAVAKLFGGDIIDHRYSPKQQMYARRHARLAHLRQFVESQMPLSPRRFECGHGVPLETWKYINHNYSLLVVGSDEVWKHRYGFKRPNRGNVRAWMNAPLSAIRYGHWRQVSEYDTPFPNVYWPRVDVPVVSMSASIGESNYGEIPLSHKRIMAQRLEKFLMLGVRDRRTLAFVLEVCPGVEERVTLVPDPVFSLNLDFDAETTKETMEIVAASGVDPTKRFAFIHVDKHLEKAASEEFRQLGIPVVNLLGLPLTPFQWCYVISLAEAGITNAMHPFIFSLLLGTPCHSIDHRTKSKELRRDFGVEEMNDVATCIANWPSDIRSICDAKRAEVEEFACRARDLSGALTR